jgi:hypothetical protein
MNRRVSRDLLLKFIRTDEDGQGEDAGSENLVITNNST